MNIKSIIMCVMIWSAPLCGSAVTTAVQADSELTSAEEQKKPLSFATGGRPLSLVFSRDNKWVAVANNLDDTITVFAVDKSTGALKPIPGSPFATGEEPASVIYSPDGMRAAVANSDDATITVFAVNQSTGALKPKGSPLKTGGVAPLSVTYSPNGRWAVVANAGSDDITAFTVNQSTGALKPINSPLKTGKGPGSVVYSPDSKWVAVANAFSDNVTVFAVNQSTGALNSGLRFAAGGVAPLSVTYSPDSKWVAVANKYSNNITVFAVDSRTGALEQIKEGSPFATGGKNPVSVTYSPDGKWVAVTNESSDNVTVFAVDRNTGAFKSIGKSFATGHRPLSAVYSPNGQLLAVANSQDNTVWVYEVDQEAGALKRITGETLKVVRQKEYDAVKKELVDSNILRPDPIPSILEEYLVGQKTAKEKKPTENTQDVALQAAIKKTAAQRTSAGDDAVKLFAAIKADDAQAVEENLTSFTINLPRGENDRTPLLEAVFLNKTNIALLLLHYKGTRQDDPYHPYTVNVNAVDSNDNTALIWAITNKNYAVALSIAERMTSEQRKKGNVKGISALVLIVSKTPLDKDKKDYDKLMQLLQE